MENIKYYVEFENTESQNAYSLQSKYFETEQDAINWYRNSFDYVDMDEIIVSVMKAKFDSDGLLDEITYCYDITAKFTLKSFVD